MSTPVPIIRNPGEGDKRAFLGGGMHTWKLMAEDTNGEFFVFEDSLAKGKCTPLHRHPEADELTYLIEGEMIVKIAGKETHLTAGAVSYVPKGVEHAFMIVSDRARLLTMQNPAVGQGFYRDASEPATDDAVDRLDLARLQESAKANPSGVEMLGPPPFDLAKAG